MPSETRLTDFTYEWHHFLCSKIRTQGFWVCARVCARRLFTLNRKARQTRWRKEKENSLFYLLIVAGFWLHCIAQLMHFLVFFGQRCPFLSLWKQLDSQEGRASRCLSLIPSQFSVLTGETSTWWTRSSGSWRWGVSMLIYRSYNTVVLKERAEWVI